jgi:LysM repeat protein
VEVVPTTAGATATPGDGCTTYVVVPGDTLSAIAARCDTTVEAIVQANVAITDPNRILVDQTLTIPGSAG